MPISQTFTFSCFQVCVVIFTFNVSATTCSVEKKKQHKKNPQIYLFVCIYIKIIYIAERSENKMFLRTAEVHLVFSGMTLYNNIRAFCFKTIRKELHRSFHNSNLLKTLSIN